MTGLRGLKLDEWSQQGTKIQRIINHKGKKDFSCKIGGDIRQSDSMALLWMR